MSGVAIPRRRFVTLLGGGIAALLVLQRVPISGAAQPCTYGSGIYGAGLYSGHLDVTAPLIEAGRSVSDVRLTWSAGPGGVSYEIWRSDRPFAPGEPTSTLVGTTAGTSFDDVGAVAAAEDLYYVVRGVSTCAPEP